jgi:hypothetical protein
VFRGPSSQAGLLVVASLAGQMSVTQFYVKALWGR